MHDLCARVWHRRHVHLFGDDLGDALVTNPSSPSAQDTVTYCSCCSTPVASPVPTIANPKLAADDSGMRRAPARSVTMAAARLMIGTQSGLVVVVTSTPPGVKRSIFLGSRMMQAGPATTAPPMLSPETSLRPFRVIVGPLKTGLPA